MPQRRKVDEKRQDADDGEQGSCGASTGLRKWGAFFDSAPLTLSYHVQSSALGRNPSKEGVDGCTLRAQRARA